MKKRLFASQWEKTNDRIWIGPEYWSNPLQDWRVEDGRLECVNTALERNVQLLTYDLKPESGTLKISVLVGRIDGNLGAGNGSCGFRIGIQGPLEEYRNSLIFGQGLNAGFAAGGELFIGDAQQGAGGKENRSSLSGKSVQLELTLTPEASRPAALS